MPAALYEIKWLATQDEAERILPLVDSILKVTEADPQAWEQLKSQMIPVQPAA